nr:hypothetical protein [Lachnospiraceae bacterium]
MNNDKSYLLAKIKTMKSRMNTGIMMRSIFNLMIIGAALCVAVEAYSVFRPFYHAHLAALAILAVSLIAGIVCGILKCRGMKEACGLIDSHGMKESVITAYENMDKEDYISVMQRSYAAGRVREKEDEIKLPLNIGVIRILGLLCLLLVSICLALLPTKAKETAEEQHEVKVEAKAVEEEIEKAIEELESIDKEGLTADEQQKLEEMIESLKASQAEVAGAQSMTDINQAVQRLDYKYADISDVLSQMAQQVADREMNEKEEGEREPGATPTPTPVMMANNQSQSSNSPQQAGGNSQTGQQLANASQQMQNHMSGNQNGNNQQAQN